jgi:hypothetical protein
VSVQGTFGAQSGACRCIQDTFRTNSGNVQGTFMEHSGTFRLFREGAGVQRGGWLCLPASRIMTSVAKLLELREGTGCVYLRRGS